MPLPVDEIRRERSARRSARHRQKQAVPNSHQQLEQANAKLKKLLAERDLEIDVMKEVAVKNV
ncbi:MAG TPA: hypothetical protein VGE08_22225 [Steroidobacter sp.]